MLIPMSFSQKSIFTFREKLPVRITPEAFLAAPFICSFIALIIFTAWKL